MKRIFGYWLPSHPPKGWIEALSDAFILSLALSECLYVVLIELEASFRTFWVCTLPLVIAVFAFELSSVTKRFTFDRWSSFHRMVALVALLAILATLFIDRPDADDETYLKIMSLALDGIDLPIREAFLPGGFGNYLWSAELILIPGGSYFSGLPLLSLYYLAVPAALALVSISFQARLVHALKMRFPVLALGFLILILLAWGDTHRSLSNTGLARFFHGKSAIPWIVMPALWTYWLAYRSSGAFRDLAFLLLCIPVGLALSPSGFYVSSLGLGMLLMGEVGRMALNPGIALRIRLAAGSFLAAFTLWALGYLGYLAPIAPGEGLAGWRWISEPPGRTDFEGLRLNAELLPHVLGRGFRGLLVYVGLALFPLFLWRRNKGSDLFPYAIVSLLLILNPLTPEMMATGFYSTMGWRWYWVLPVVPSLLLLNDRLAGLWRWNSGRWAPSALLLGAYAFSSGAWVASAENHARIVAPRHRLPRGDSERLHEFPDRPGSVIELRGRRLVTPKGNLY